MSLKIRRYTSKFLQNLEQEGRLKGKRWLLPVLERHKERGPVTF